MTHKKLKNILAKAAGLALSVSALLGILTYGAPTSAVQAADGTAQVNTHWSPGTMYQFGAENIQDGDYMYMGHYLDGVAVAFRPILNRVLDNDADNTGEAGAMFLMTENALPLGPFYDMGAYFPGMSHWESSMFATANVYSLSPLSIHAKTYTGSIFLSERWLDGGEDGVADSVSFIRPVTKTDTEESMAGLFCDHTNPETQAACTECFYPKATPYYFETEDHIFYYEGVELSPDFNESRNDMAMSGDTQYEYQTEAQLLQEHPYFLLSVAELAQYLWPSEGAALQATDLDGNPVVWMTRTGMGETYISGAYYNGGGQYVAGIDENGQVIPVHVEDETAYSRLGFNIEKSAIIYNYAHSHDTYQVATLYQGYRGEDAPEFRARVLGTEGGVVTLEYQNTYNPSSPILMSSYVSVMILDKDGKVKSYANVAEMTGSTYATLNEKATTVQFSLPSTYNEEEDTLRIFWECKPDDGQGIIYASNFVDLDCVHMIQHTGGTVPTCTEEGYCEKCGENYGTLDPENHEALSGWNTDEKTHWHSCANEAEHAGTAELTHRVNEAAHTFVFDGCRGTCSDCGYAVVDDTRCIYDENGLCSHGLEGHYETPTFSRNEYHEKFVYVEKPGHWLYMADAINNGREIVLLNDVGINYYYYIPGTKINVVVSRELDFTGIPFVPLGKIPEAGAEMQDTYFMGTLTCKDGSDSVVIKGIHYDQPDGTAVGLLGYAKDATVFGITLLDSTFKGASRVGALVGYGQSVSFNNCVVGYVIETAEIREVVVSATDGSAGAFIGYAEDSAVTNVNLYHNLAIGVRDINGTDLAFTSSATPAGELTVGASSFCLFATDGELGCTSAEAFASGVVTYKLGMLVGGWSQLLDADTNGDGTVDEYDEDPQPFPRRVPKNSIGQRVDTVYSVYAVTDCEGNVFHYTNTVTRHGQHVPETVLEWRWDSQFCEALVICKICGKEVLMDTHVEMDYTWVPVRGDYTAYLMDPDGNYYYEPGACADEECPCEDCDPETCTEYYCAPKPFSDTISITGIWLQDLIAMEQWVVDYDGYGVYPEDMMNNHRLNTGTPAPAYKEYEVYFLDEAGNMIYEDAWDYYGKYYQQPAAAVDAGSYDLVVVGKNDFEGQTYIYEDILVINPVVVELEPRNVYKYHDGTASFTPDFRFTDPAQEELFEAPFDFIVTYGEASSSAEGVYTIRVTVTPDEYHDPRNIQFVLTRETVQAVIVPRLFVEAENKSYPTTFEYGDTIPVPTSEHFRLTEGSTLTFAWYKADLETYDFEDPVTGEWIPMVEVNSITAIEGQPKDVGDYILRVYASGVGKLAGVFTDVVVTITPATGLTLELDTSGLEIDEVTGYYILEMGQTIPYTVQGFKNGETLETSDVKVEIDYRYSWGSSSGGIGFPTVPSRYNYYILYTLRSENYQEKEEYESGASFDYFRTGVYVVMVVGDNVMPAPGEYLTTDTEKPMSVYLSWPSVEGATSYDILVSSDEEYNNLISLDEKSTEDGNNFARVSLTRSGTYYVKIQNDVTDNPRTFAFILSITDPHGNQVDEIGNELGDYTVTLTHEARTLTSTVTVRREIAMYVKECEHNADAGDLLVLDPTRIVMEAGKVIRLDHTLVEILARVNADYGEILVESIKVVDQNGNDVSDFYQLDNYPYGLSHHSENGYCVAHIFDNACDAECNIYSCEYTRVTYHTGGEATCLAQAVCEKCHTPYGEVAHENHLGTATHIAPNGADLETHLEVYSCCGQTKAVKDHVEGTPATCTDRAICAECGWAYGALNPANHASTEVSHAYLDEDRHMITHLCCDATEEGGHNGGTATCQSAAICKDCNHAYGARNPHNHAGKISYSEHADHATMHVEFYACCQVSRDVRHSGGTATCTDRAICEGCRQAYGELAPHHHASDELIYTVRADNGSMHDVTHACCGTFIRKEYHEGGTATCTSAAICDHCGEEYGSRAQANNHESDELIYRVDPNQPTLHIAYHACCGKESHREDHTGGTASCTHGSICSDCGYEYGERLAHEFDNICDSICNVCGRQVRPLVFHVDANADGTCDHCATPITGDGLSASAVADVTRAITQSLYAVGGEAGVTTLPLIATASALRVQTMELTCVSAVADTMSDRRALSETATETAVTISVASLAWNPVAASETARGEDSDGI